MSSSSPSIALSLSHKPLPTVKVSAQVVLSILNSFSRRTNLSARVVGALLGEVQDNQVIHVTDCYAVKFEENMEENKCMLDMDYLRTMYSFHRRNNKKEVLVGWYATTTPYGSFLSDTSAMLHDAMKADCPLPHPIHLVVDTTLSGDSLSFKAFVARKNMIGDSFLEVASTLQMNEAEASLIRQLVRGQTWQEPVVSTKLASGSQRMEASFSHYSAVLDQLQQYVDDVVDEKIVGNRDIGIALAEALNDFSQKNLSSSQLQLLQSRYQDLLMISYLSTLAQSQTLVAEKLNQII